MATIIFFHAHPDDEAVATSGTMIKAAQNGHRVVLIFATKGEFGIIPSNLQQKNYSVAEQRVNETLEAAQILEVSRVEFLGYLDSGMRGELGNYDVKSFFQADIGEASSRLAKILIEEMGEILVTYDSRGGYDHPDHLKCHLVGTKAAKIANTEKVFWTTLNRDRMEIAQAAGNLLDEEWIRRTSTKDFWMPESKLTHAIDVTNYLHQKQAAMKSHKSQITSDSFFLEMDNKQFEAAFKTEWYVATHLNMKDWIGSKLLNKEGFFTDLLHP